MSRALLPIVALLAALAALPASAATATPLEFKPGNPKMAAMLARLSATRELAAEAFSVAMLDLNGDGQQEIIVRSDGRGFCGSGGCLTVVLEQQGPMVAPLLSQNLFPNLGVTREKVGAYRALAALDPSGAIVVGDKAGTPLYGKPLVYPMQAAAGGRPAAAQTVAQSTPTTARSDAGGASRTSATGLPDVLGVKPGMTPDEAMAILRQHKEYKQLKTWPIQLAYTNSKSARSPVPNGKVQGAIADSGPGALEKVGVGFSLLPADERAVVIGRYSIYSDQQRPLVDNVLSGLKEKYGKPSFEVRSDFNATLMWAYNSDGSPRPLSVDPFNGLPCGSFNGVIGNSAGAYPDWVLSIFKPELEWNRKIVSVASTCGDVLVKATLVVQQGGFVNGLQVHLFDNKNATAYREKVISLINQAASTEMGRDRRDASQNKPKF
jgi:hypothetical protein